METPADKYNPQVIEAHWQRRWAETGIYRTPDPEGKPTFYCLDFFPYPSGDGLSVGHGRNYVPSDVISRYHRMKGDAVLHPMGWDAFGLPAENEAINKGIHPRETTTRYGANYRRQMTLIGCSYDWEREINSSQPDFYRWTQWFFLLLYRRGLAARPSWPTSRSSPAASAGAATKGCTSATWNSGTSASLPTPTNCWPTWRR
jgi:leucyl-tRNA synthetase